MYEDKSVLGTQDLSLLLLTADTGKIILHFCILKKTRQTI